MGRGPARSTRAELVDLVVLGALCGIGLFGFRGAYGGTGYLVAGLIGLALGLAIAWWGAHSRQPQIVVVAVTALAFFLFGGAAAVPAHAYGGILPSPNTIADLVDGAIQGWARLLTMNPPVGDTANLLVIPYLCGLISGVLSLSIALRWRRPVLALAVPVLLLVLSILFGAMQPASLLLQGTVFGVIALWWVAHLERGRRRVDAGTGTSRRWIGAVAMLAAAGLIAHFAWSSMPGATSNPRIILRNYTEPPFDPADYPSPLVEYRRYTNGANEVGWQPTPEEAAASGAPSADAEAREQSKSGWRGTELFKVEGLPADQRLRIATLDSYDRVVYSVGSGPQSSGYFQRVGEQLPEPVYGERPDGETQEVTVDVLGDNAANLYEDIWLPVPDNTTSVRFVGDDAQRVTTLDESLLWNAATGTAALPVRLAAGDTYTLTSVRTPVAQRQDFADATAANVTTTAQQVQAVAAAARDLAEKWDCEPPPSAPTPIEPTSAYDKILLIAQGLTVCGGLSDGADSPTGIPAYPGHSDRRLTDMLAENSDGMLGNGEQFAPLAALLSEAVGLPARVVMGFRSKAESDTWREAHGLAKNDADYVVRGSDIAAWIEVALDRGHGTEWVEVRDVTPTKPTPQLRPPPRQLDPESDPPPPPPSIPPSEDEAESATCRTTKSAAAADAEQAVGERASGSDCETNEDADGAGFKIPAWVVKTAVGVSLPLLVLAVITVTIGGLKSRRRKRRRTTGTPVERVDGGWHEITDLASDLGASVPPRVTRREAGSLIARPEAVRLACRADAAIFGPSDPSELEVDQYWDEVETTRSAMLSDLSRFGRWKVLVSLSSLRASGQRGLARQFERRRRGRTSGPVSTPPPSTTTLATDGTR